jgi:hypothetical protein
MRMFPLNLPAWVFYLFDIRRMVNVTQNVGGRSRWEERADAMTRTVEAVFRCQQ